MASNEPCDDTGDTGSTSAPPSQEINLAPRTRFCSVKGCKSRLALQVYEPHTTCVTCRGKKCDLGVRCSVCELWDDSTMAEYLAHQHRLEQKRKAKKPVASQGVGSNPEGQVMSAERESRLQQAIENNLMSFLKRQQKDLTRSVVSEIKELISGKNVPSPNNNDDDVVEPIAPEPVAPNNDPNVPGPSQAVPENPSPLPTWSSDSRYTRAKSLYDDGCLTAQALNEIALICKADANVDPNVPNPDLVEEPVGPPPPKKPRSEYDPNEDPDFGIEPDFGDLLSCMCSLYPEAKDKLLVEKASEFLFGAAAVTNKREFIRLKFFSEMSNCQSEVNEKVAKVSLGAGKVLNVWPRHKQYYRVNSFPETVKINPRVTELCYIKNIPNSLTFSFSISEAQALDRALAELVQSQSFSFWLLSSFFSFLEQEDFSPSNPSLYNKFTTILSTITQTQASWSLALQSFLTLIRRKSVMNKFLSSVLHHQKEKLLRSPCFTDTLFDEGVLEQVILEHSNSQLSQSQIQMAKFFTASNYSRTPPSFNQRGQRRPFSRPFFVARGRGNRGGRGKGKKSNNRGGKAQRANPPKNV